MRRTLFHWTLVLAGLAALGVGCKDDDDDGGGCDTCDDDSDCAGGLTCSLFSDGLGRCANSSISQCESFGSSLFFVTELPGFTPPECEISCSMSRSSDHEPPWMAVDDLNADNIADLVTTDRIDPGSGFVSVQLGGVRGAFRDPRRFPAGDGAAVVTLGDVNLDDVLDIVAAGQTPARISVLLGNGDGTFGTRQTFDAGGSPSLVVVEDVNADRVPDVVTVDLENGTAWYLLGNGDSTFQSAQVCVCSESEGQT